MLPKLCTIKRNVFTICSHDLLNLTSARLYFFVLESPYMLHKKRPSISRGEARASCSLNELTTCRHRPVASRIELKVVDASGFPSKATHSVSVQSFRAMRAPEERDENKSRAVHENSDQSSYVPRKDSTRSIGVSTNVCKGSPSAFRASKKPLHSDISVAHSASALPMFLMGVRVAATADSGESL